MHRAFNWVLICSNTRSADRDLSLTELGLGIEQKEIGSRPSEGGPSSGKSEYKQAKGEARGITQL